jgi:hypothetical protein
MVFPASTTDMAVVFERVNILFLGLFLVQRHCWTGTRAVGATHSLGLMQEVSSWLPMYHIRKVHAVGTVFSMTNTFYAEALLYIQRVRTARSSAHTVSKQRVHRPASSQYSGTCSVLTKCMLLLCNAPSNVPAFLPHLRCYCDS